MCNVSIVPNVLQRAAIDCALIGQSVTVMGGFNCGKSTMLAQLALLLGRARPGLQSAWVTDTAPHAERIIMPMAKHYLGGAGWIYRGRQEQKIWVSPAGHELFLLIYRVPEGRDPQDVGGQGANLTFLLADECQQLQWPGFHQFAMGRVRVPGPNGEPPWACYVGLPRWDAPWVEAGVSLGWKYLRCSSHINPATSREYIERLRATYSREDFDEKVLARPRAPEGAVWKAWSPQAWPAGNVLAPGWTHRPEMSTALSVDFGSSNPALLWIAHDPDLGVDVIFDESAPMNAGIDEIVASVLSRAWPRQYSAEAPAGTGRWIDYVCGDPAGALDARVLGQSPEGVGLGRGLGVRPILTTDPAKRLRREGVRRVSARMCSAAGDRRLAITDELWRRGLSSSGRTIAKSIGGLAWTAGDIYGPKALTHLSDALRYWGIAFWWYDSERVETLEFSARVSRKTQGGARWKRGTAR